MFDHPAAVCTKVKTFPQTAATIPFFLYNLALQIATENLRDLVFRKLKFFECVRLHADDLEIENGMDGLEISLVLGITHCPRVFCG